MLLPDITLGDSFESETDKGSVYFWSSKFQTCWPDICLVPSAELRVDECPEPSARGTAISGMPVVLLPVMKYIGLLKGLKNFDSTSSLNPQSTLCICILDFAD